MFMNPFTGQTLNGLGKSLGAVRKWAIKHPKTTVIGGVAPLSATAGYGYTKGMVALGERKKRKKAATTNVFGGAIGAVLNPSEAISRKIQSKMGVKKKKKKAFVA